MAFAVLASESEDLVLASAAVLDQLMSSYLGCVGSMAPLALVAFFHPAAWCRPCRPFRGGRMGISRKEVDYGA